MALFQEEPNVYIAVIYGSRTEYDYFANVCGIFTTKEAAVNSLAQYLIKNKFIFYDTYYDRDDKETDTNSEINNDNKTEYDRDVQRFAAKQEKSEQQNLWLSTNLNEEEEFLQSMLEKIEGDLVRLYEYCEIYGKSYYKDCWNIKIDKCKINSEK